MENNLNIPGILFLFWTKSTASIGLRCSQPNHKIYTRMLCRQLRSKLRPSNPTKCLVFYPELTQLVEDEFHNNTSFKKCLYSQLREKNQQPCCLIMEAITHGRYPKTFPSKYISLLMFEHAALLDNWIVVITPFRLVSFVNISDLNSSSVLFDVLFLELKIFQRKISMTPNSNYIANNSVFINQWASSEDDWICSLLCK